MKRKYPRLVIYKARNLCRHEDSDLPWRVILQKDGRNYGMVEFKSRTVESCWEHVAYRLGRKLPRPILTKTLRTH